jgi:FKBP-type peptidyl-prolyl cis-trans isomerase SlyD
VIDRTEDGQPLCYVHGYGQILPRLEQALEGLIEGQQRSVTLAPEEGYGDYDEDAVFEVERSDFPAPEKIQVDDEFVAESDDGEAVSMRVVEILPEAVIVDANHPLAGESLRFDLQVVEVRPASPAELSEAELEFERRRSEEEHGGSPRPELLTIGRKPGAGSGQSNGAGPD